MPEMSREVPIRALALTRREAPLPRIPGHVRRAQAIESTGVKVGSGDVGGFTLDSLRAAVANLEGQGHAGDAPLAAKVIDHPIGDHFPDMKLVAILAIVPAPAGSAE